MKVESVAVARAPLSVSPKLKKTLVLPRSERKLSESDDIKLLSPDSDCGGLVSQVSRGLCVCVCVCVCVSACGSRE